MSQRTIMVTNKLNILNEAILAESPSTEQTRIEWSGDPYAPNTVPVEFLDTETLTLTIENGASAEFDLYGYAELSGWIDFDFKGNPSCPGGADPQITVARSYEEARITIKKGKADFTLEIKPTTGEVKPGEENVKIGDDQN